ncbi:MAG: rhamnulokinase [Erysipelotrichaceae bacterium]|nr:rhamnulokinase [Erysipelotrichaceae bacterium]
MMKYHLAVDIGASSGRHIIGWLEEGKLCLKEIWRFENRLMEKDGHLCWDIDGLFRHVKEGIAECGRQGYHPETMGIDTWAVDFVLLDREGKRISDAVAYRDERTNVIREELEEKGILSFKEQYALTGIQYQKFNTAYQLCALKKEHPEQLEQADALLMIPDYLNYLLTGKKAQEYTNATTTALVSARTKDWDKELIRRLGLPETIFQKIREAGSVLGEFTEEIQKETGLNMKVILPATHDTGSAYLAVPAQDENAVFLSSGTWSLLGVENSDPITDEESMKQNFTNEGGYEYRFRYLKNIMGLWMIQNIRRELTDENGNRPSFPQLIEEAQKAKDFPSCLDADDDRFLAPASMIEEVRQACRDTHQPVPETVGEVMQTVYASLADDYRRAVLSLERLTGRKYTSMNIVGGGSQDMYLNQMTADATGLTVYAGPTEGTALGNLLVQMMEEKEIASLQKARNIIRNSFEIREVKPQ